MIDELLRRNAAHTASAPDRGGLGPQPRQALAVLTCMDCRIEPAELLGLEVGDAHVLRNAGARVTDDVMRSLAVSLHVFGVRTLLVIGHTGCGLTSRSNADLVAAVEQSAGVQLAAGYDFLAAPDPDAAVTADVERLRADPLLASVEVAGLVVDLGTGRLRQVL